MAGTHAQERAGEAVAMSADIESVLPFEAVIAAAGVGDEAELADAIESDAAAMMDLGEPVTLQRYASVVDFEAHARAAEAATAAYARSLQRFEGLEASAAEAMAREEAKATADLQRRPGAGRRVGRRRPRRRAGKQLGIWTPVQLVLMFVFGAGMAVATLYWMGIVSTTRELHIQEKMNRMKEESLRQQAEEQAIALEKEWDAVKKTSMGIITMVEDEMEDGHLRDAAEVLIALETVYHELARHRPEVLDAYGESRLDDIVMPALRRIYNVDELGGEETMESIRDRLAQLEQERIEEARKRHAETSE
jgi:hypothetical protein